MSEETLIDGVAMDNAIKPVYEFTWDDGSTRRTDNLDNKAYASEEAIEILAMMGRSDEECEVKLVGYET